MAWYKVHTKVRRVFLVEAEDARQALELFADGDGDLIDEIHDPAFQADVELDRGDSDGQVEEV